MLQYDWGSSSSNGNPNSQSVVPIIDETGSYVPDPALTIYHHHDPFNQQQSTHHFNPETHFIPSVNPLFQTPQNNSHQTTTAHHPHHHHQHFASATMYDASQRVYDTRTDGSYPLPLTLEPIGFVKPEPVAAGLEWGSGSSASSRLGLNLGGRTFYAEDDFVNRLYRRSRMLEPGSVSAPRCQAEGCNADLSHAKHYHRRHKVCEFHSKASTVIANGLTQRFCQQCSRFHLLPEFDNGKRSCRKRLADHNRRRRKSQQQPNQENNSNKSQLENNNNNSSSENATRSPSDSRAHSSSVTIAISPPRISVDCFGHGSYNNNGASASTSSTSSLFYSNG